eukprot:1392949-Amorphochlora_amoeboformis.AAC.1
MLRGKTRRDKVNVTVWREGIMLRWFRVAVGVEAIGLEQGSGFSLGRDSALPWLLLRGKLGQGLRFGLVMLGVTIEVRLRLWSWLKSVVKLGLRVRIWCRLMLRVKLGLRGLG